MEIPIHTALSEDGTAAVTVLGEIDFSNSDEVARGIRHAVATWSPQEIQIDLAGATFIDSTGLGALIEGYQAAMQAGCRFVVTSPSDDFRRVLAVTGLDDLFGTPEQDRTSGLSQASGV